MLNVFLLLSVSWWLPEGFHNQAEAEGSPSSGPVYSGGSVLLSSSDIPNHWSPWQCHRQHDIRLNLGGIVEVSDEARFGMTKESCVQPPLSWKQTALFWFMASKASVQDCVASCTWEEHCGDKSMRQRTAVQTVVSREQRLWWDRQGSSSIKDLHLVTHLLPPATSPYLVRTNLSVNELLEGNALGPNYNNGVRGKGRQGCWLMQQHSLQDLQGTGKLGHRRAGNPVWRQADLRRREVWCFGLILRRRRLILLFKDSQIRGILS